MLLNKGYIAQSVTDCIRTNHSLHDVENTKKVKVKANPTLQQVMNAQRGE